MIDYQVELIRKTSDRFGSLSKSADRQCSDVKIEYDAIKSALELKINEIESGISTAEAERGKASDVISHNQAVAAKTQEIINRARARLEKLRAVRSKRVATLSKLEGMLSVARSLPSGKNTDRAVSNLQSSISEIRSDINEIDAQINEQNEIIRKAEEKLRKIESANAQLETILQKINKDIVRLKSSLSMLKNINTNIVQLKKGFDEAYGQTKRTMQLVHERTARAQETAFVALRYFSEAGCGVSKTVKVDSPSVIFNLSSQIEYAASDLTRFAFELGLDADRYGAFMRDRISIDAREEAKQAKVACDEKYNEWSSKALSLKNAAYQLQFYLECKL